LEVGRGVSKPFNECEIGEVRETTGSSLDVEGGRRVVSTERDGDGAALITRRLKFTKRIGRPEEEGACSRLDANDSCGGDAGGGRATSLGGLPACEIRLMGAQAAGDPLSIGEAFGGGGGAEELTEGCEDGLHRIEGEGALGRGRG